MPLTPGLAAILFLAALAAGFIDAIAGGGGLIAVPVLMGAGLPPQIVLGTNKLQSSCGTLLAVARYARAGLVAWKDVRLAAVVTFASASLGAYVVTQVSNDILKAVVPWLLLTIAVYALVSPRLGVEPRPARLAMPAFAWLAGSVLGFYDGFFGPGTGSFWTLALLTLAGYELTRATAYTKVVNLASNLASVIIFVAAGKVRYDFALIMIAGQLIGARAGAGMVLRHGAQFVRVVFLLVVFSLTAKLLWDTL
jgi:hypothetical protein